MISMLTLTKGTIDSSTVLRAVTAQQQAPVPLVGVAHGAIAPSRRERVSSGTMRRSFTPPSDWNGPRTPPAEPGGDNQPRQRESGEDGGDDADAERHGREQGVLPGRAPGDREPAEADGEEQDQQVGDPV